MVSVESPAAIIIGAAVALFFLLVALGYALRKVAEVGLLLIAATLSFAIPIVARALPGAWIPSAPVFALLGIFPLIAFALAGFAVLQMLKRVRPTRLSVPEER